MAERLKVIVLKWCAYKECHHSHIMFGPPGPLCRLLLESEFHFRGRMFSCDTVIFSKQQFINTFMVFVKWNTCFSVWLWSVSQEMAATQRQADRCTVRLNRADRRQIHCKPERQIMISVCWYHTSLPDTVFIDAHGGYFFLFLTRIVFVLLLSFIEAVDTDTNFDIFVQQRAEG